MESMIEEILKEFDEKLNDYAEHVLYQDGRGHDADAGKIHAMKSLLLQSIKKVVEGCPLEGIRRDVLGDYVEEWKSEILEQINTLSKGEIKVRHA